MIISANMITIAKNRLRTPIGIDNTQRMINRSTVHGNPESASSAPGSGILPPFEFDLPPRPRQAGPSAATRLMMAIGTNYLVLVISHV